jgi:uncharacterized protein
LLPPLQEYKIHNCDLLFKEDSTVDDLIDVIEVSKQIAESVARRVSGCVPSPLRPTSTVVHAQGNRRYIKCLYVYNKIDVCRCCVLHVTTANVVVAHVCTTQCSSLDIV